MSTAHANWSDPWTLETHFDKHVADFNAGSADEHADSASDFFQRPGAQKLPTKIDSDGDIRMHDHDTNIFGAFASDGETKTLFQPTSLGYWLR